MTVLVCHRESGTIDHAAAGEQPLERLAGLWNPGHEGCFVPVDVTEGQFRVYVQRKQIDLGRSLLAVVDGEPVGF